MKLPTMEKQTTPVDLTEVEVFEDLKRSSLMKDIGLLILRLTFGGLLAGHGSQKLFGWFGGFGLKGTAGWMESMGLKPGTPWATMASASEFGGGLLTGLGFLHPLGPLATMGAMLMAIAKAHWGKPIWVSQGGAELPIINIATALANTLTGPGRFSLDRLFGIRVPRVLVIATIVAEAVLVGIGIMSRPKPTPAPTTEQQQEKATVA